MIGSGTLYTKYEYGGESVCIRTIVGYTYIPDTWDNPTLSARIGPHLVY